jgi:feruloyl esterase
MLSVLVDWVEQGKAPGDLEVVEQRIEAPAFATTRSLPLCRWPAWPHYKSGAPSQAASFACAP